MIYENNRDKRETNQRRHQITFKLTHTILDGN